MKQMKISRHLGMLGPDNLAVEGSERTIETSRDRPDCHYRLSPVRWRLNVSIKEQAPFGLVPLLDTFIHGRTFVETGTVVIEAGGYKEGDAVFAAELAGSFVFEVSNDYEFVKGVFPDGKGMAEF